MIKQSNWSKVSRHERGYGNEWSRIRLIVLKRDNGLCQCKECQGGKKFIRQANEVHHIISKAKGGTDELGNLQAINRACHMRETAAEQGRSLKPRMEVGADGWPREVTK